MFRFTRKPSSGSHSQYLAKITHLDQCEYIDVIQTLSVLWLHNMTCEACVLCSHSMTCEACVLGTVWACTRPHSAQHSTALCSHNTDKVCTTSIRVHPHWTKRVILAKYWLLAPWWWFPCKPKPVGAASLILICFNNSMFLRCVH
jgi:hypothetical protein